MAFYYRRRNRRGEAGAWGGTPPPGRRGATGPAAAGAAGAFACLGLSCGRPLAGGAGGGLGRERPAIRSLHPPIRLPITVLGFKRMLFTDRSLRKDGIKA